ncbi:MAG: hypothetical protein ACRYF0_19725 [Janthinobacterium lividum]
MSLFSRLLGPLLLASLSQLTSCALLGAGPPWHPPLALAADTAGPPPTIIYAKNYYAGSYKDRHDRRAEGSGTFVTKANAPVATGASQAQDFTRAGQQGGALASAATLTHQGIPGWVLIIIGLVIISLAVLYAYRREITSFIVT